MSNADRIEELRDKYEENPRRYFAPLANEYRKAGDLAQAIAICREHLPKQPGHMSGYIVFGQTLFEANSLEEARTVFEQALTLDPENLIALKHLGDIARMSGENSVARRWYARVLDADPRNDDIASQLASLGAPTPVVPIAAVPAPAPYSAPPIEEAIGVFATFDPSSLLDVPEDVAGVAADHQFWSPTKVQPAAQHEPLDLDFPESPEPEAEADFEEGILAPEWPDTSELVARIVTPFRAATPVSLPITPDAVEAFGREAADAKEAAPFDLAPQDDLVAAFLPPDATPPSIGADEEIRVEAIDHAVEVIDNGSDAFDFETGNGAAESFAFEAIAKEPMPESGGFSEPISVALDEPAPALESVALSYAEDELIDFDSVEDAAPSSVEPDSVGSATPDASEETISTLSRMFESPPMDTPTETSAPVGEWAEPESVPHSEIEDFAFAAELPWEPEAVAEPDTPAALEPVAEDIAVTAEFPVPMHFASGVQEAVESTPVPDAATDDVVAEAPALAPVEQPAEVLEESFAEISSELQHERDAFDRTVLESETAAAETGAHEAVSEDVVTEDVVSLDVVSEYVVSEDVVSADVVSADVVSADVVSADVVSEDVVSEDVVSEDVVSEDVVSDEVVSEDVVSDEGVRNEVVPSEVVSTESEPAQPFVTETMAELLVSQGFYSRAIEVYDELVRRRPHDPVLVSRLAELREIEASDLIRAEHVSSAHTPRFTTPQRSTPIYNTPLYSTPMSATPVLLSSLSESASTQSNLSERHAADRLQPFRTARERFAELARRRVARRTPTHATAISDDATDGLSSLFGTALPASTDELAARALADAFGPVQDSGESLFDPAPSPTPSMPMRSLTPRASSIIPLASHSENRSDRQLSADYSFDKFFPDPAMAAREAQSSPSAVAPTPASPQPVNEDLAQFSAWLKGLNNA